MTHLLPFPCDHAGRRLLQPRRGYCSLTPETKVLKEIVTPTILNETNATMHVRAGGNWYLTPYGANAGAYTEGSVASNGWIASSGMRGCLSRAHGDRSARAKVDQAADRQAGRQQTSKQQTSSSSSSKQAGMAFDRSPACSRRRAQPRRAHHRAARTTGYRSCPARRCLRAHKCDPSWKHHAIARNSAQASTEFLGQTRVVRVVKSAVPGSSLRPYMISWSGQICGVAKIVCFGVPRALTRVSTAARDSPPSLLILQGILLLPF